MTIAVHTRLGRILLYPPGLPCVFALLAGALLGGPLLNSSVANAASAPAAVVAAGSLAPSPQPLPAGASQWTERLAALNPVPGPINLRGDRGEFDLFFSLSTRIDPTGGNLHLELSNSQALLAGRSQFVIRLNDVVVAQLALKPDAPLATMDVALPVELLKGGGNRLNFEAAQHYTNECESTSAAELWSQIDTTRSRLTISGRAVDAAPLLSELPDLIGPGLFGGRRFTLMAPMPATGISDATIDTGAALSEALGLRLRYQPATIGFAEAKPDGSAAPTLRLAPPPAAATLGNAEPDIVLFGTLDELRPLLGPQVAGAITTGFVGIYALPSDRRRLVIVVSGTNDVEMRRAATAFGIANFPFVDASEQTIQRLEMAPDDIFFSRNLLREGTQTTFASLGFKTTTLRGINGQAGIDVTMPADLYLADSAEAELSLDYAYGAGMRADSVMNVMVNGEFQQAISLSDQGGAVLRGYRIHLPARKLRRGQNHISFEMVMSPLISGSCVAQQTGNLILSLADTSSIMVARGARVAAQPDLQLFAATGFPYIGGPDAGGHGFDVAFAARDPATIGAGWTLLSRLSQLSGRILTEAHTLVGAPTPDRDAILIGAAPDIAGIANFPMPVGLQKVASFPYESAAPRPGVAPSVATTFRSLVGMSPLTENDRAAPSVSRIDGFGSLGRNGLMMAEQARGGGSFTLTTLTAASRDTLWTATQSLVGPGVWPQLNDDVTLWRPAPGARPASPGDAAPLEVVFTQRVSPTYHIGSFGTLFALRYFVSEYPIVWLAAIAAAVIVLVLMLRLFLVARRRRVHPGSTEGIP